MKKNYTQIAILLFYAYHLDILQKFSFFPFDSPSSGFSRRNEKSFYYELCYELASI